jgi:branched-chain amino acid aminotransferase
MSVPLSTQVERGVLHHFVQQLLKPVLRTCVLSAQMWHHSLVAVGTTRTFEIDGGRLLPLGESPSLASASATLPQGSYTSLRTYDGRRVLRLAQHFQRLEESLPEGPVRLDPDVVRRGLASALDATGFPESRIRLTFAPPRVFVSVEPFEPLPEALYEQGIVARTLDVHRDDPHRKDTHFIATADRAYRDLPPGIQEGLLVAADGSLLEGLTSNFFAVLGGRLRTEEARVLLGVTRSLVLEIARGLLPVDLTAIRREELPAVSEAFVTSVSREVLPVVRIDGQTIGDGRPGERTRALRERFRALVEREAEPV